jgi:hypothetical protein
MALLPLEQALLGRAGKKSFVKRWTLLICFERYETGVGNGAAGHQYMVGNILLSVRTRVKPDGKSLIAHEFR